MAPSTKTRILDGALDLLRVEGGGSVTLDAAARQVGLTKPGLMYHFPTMEALKLAIVDHVAGRWERMLLDRLDGPLDTASPYQRTRAYVEVALTARFDRADYAVCTEALYRDAFHQTWVRRFDPWLRLPDDLPDQDRARLTAARLMADGFWTAAATGAFTVPERDRARLVAITDDLLRDGTV
jgi:AcrR family transcriptional regulator